MFDLIPFSFSDKSSVLLIFFLNLGILAVLLFRKWIINKEKSELWVASFTILCALYISPFMFGYAGWYTKDLYQDILFYLPLQQLLLIGPVIYFYIQFLLRPIQRLHIADLYHFAPAILYNLFILVVFINDIVIESDYYFYADGMDMDLDPWYQWAGLFSMTGYLILALRHYNRYKKLALNTLSYADDLLYNWAQQFLYVFLMLLILRVLFFILNPEWGEFGSKYWYYVSFSILALYLSFRGYLHSVQMEAGSKAIQFSPIDASVLLTEPSNDVSETSILENKEYLVGLLEKVENEIEDDKLYLNPRLTVTELSGQVGIHQKEISNAINALSGMNFNDWVNKYRVGEVIERFKKGEGASLTVLGIAMECGFNSKSTFNRAFKKQTGKTPVEYLKTLK